MNILSFFAHPDDETMLAGGALALLAKLGHSVHYLVCTRGEGGEVGEPPVCDQEKLGKFRTIETINAVKALGGKTVEFLDYIDPIVGPDNLLFTFSDDIENIVTQLSKVVRKHHINSIISHGSNGEYGHPAHKTVFQAVKLYFEVNNNSDINWYTAQANYPNPIKPHLINKDDPASWILDIKPVIYMKINAAKAHVSQNALFVRRSQKELKRNVSLEEVIAEEEAYYWVRGSKDDLLSTFRESKNIRE
ncbi:MAG: PIG-L deacetylase family protein [Anaerolineaceae bacterium]